jgi:ABC transporter substrate binding protein
MHRRSFLTLLGASAAAWPLAARAQQPDRVRRIGVLMPFAENDPEVKLRYSAFTEALAHLGWTDGRNVRMDLRSAGSDANRIRALAQVVAGAQVPALRELIIRLAAQHRLPAVYPFRHYVASGGLISYGPDQVDQWRPAAGYVDRILRGEKPADLPVQAPTKYETVLNLKTAKALGLDVPATVLVRADEVIE